MNKVTISKIDVAKDELTAALTFFLDYKHPIAVHTLTFAAYHVLRGISKGMKTGTTIYDMIKPGVSKERKTELMRALDKSYSYFKHADEDFDIEHEFNLEQTEWMLLWAVNLFKEVAGYKTPLMLCFELWMEKVHPEIASDAFTNYLKSSKHIIAQTDDRRAFKELEVLFPSTN